MAIQHRRSPRHRQLRARANRFRQLQFEGLEDRRVLALGDWLATLDNPSTTPNGARSIAADGIYTVVGVPGAVLHGKHDVGVAYLFDSTTGSLLHRLDCPTSDSPDQFGFSVAISGNTIVVGGPQNRYRSSGEIEPPGPPDYGSAFVFSAETGKLLHTLQNPTPRHGDLFGYSVAIASNAIVVGAAGDISVGSAYVYDATTGSLIRTLSNPAPSESDAFGLSVAISASAIVVGAPYDSAPPRASGSVYVFDAATGNLLRTINNPTPAESDQFGAAIAISVNQIVIAAHNDDAGALGTGTVYLFDVPTGNLLGTLNVAAPADSGNFGVSVALSANAIVVGRISCRVVGCANGPAYIFDASTRNLLRTVHSPLPSASDQFGVSVTVSGSKVFATSPGSYLASAHVFDVTTGSLLASMVATTPSAYDGFGDSVAMDGNRLVVGSPFEDAGAYDAGAVYIYDTRTSQLLRKLNNPRRGYQDYFGAAVAISGDIIVVGATSSQMKTEAVYVFDAITGNLLHTLTNPEPPHFAAFGSAVSIWGNSIVVGASNDFYPGMPNVVSAGSVYVFDAVSGNLVHTLRNPTPADNEWFGVSVGISGNKIVVGAPIDEIAVGAAYIFDTSTGSLLHTLKPTPGGQRLFGKSVAISGNNVVVGAPRDSEVVMQGGSIYVFDALSGNRTHILRKAQPQANDLLGEAVGVFAGTILVGDDGALGPYGGAALLFSATSGALLRTVTKPQATTIERFGDSVAIAAGGIAVGAPFKPGASLNRGGTYLFEGSAIAPIAVADSYTTPEDTLLTTSAPGVLANDTGGAASAVLDQGPTRGTLSLNANGGFTYIPSANLFGLDSFTYRASDGKLTSNLATVTINVAPVNDPPIANSDFISTLELATHTLFAPGLLANDLDADGDFLITQLVTGPANGTLTLNPYGGLQYTARGFSGRDGFTYRTSDGLQVSNVASVSISVFPCFQCQTPAAVDDLYITPTNTPIEIVAPGILKNDLVVNGKTLLPILVTAPASGTLSLNPSGSFRYTPVPNFKGYDLFSYRASDGVVTTNIATVKILVTEAIDPPLAMNDFFYSTVGGQLTVQSGGIFANDIDLDAGSLVATLVAGPAQGALVLHANGGFTYTPPSCFAGVVSFTYRASDGSVTSNLANVTLTISEFPATTAGALPDSFTLFEDTQLNVAAPGVLANDGDRCHPATVAELVSGPARGAVSLDASGSFRYTPTADFHGTDNFTYRTKEGQATTGFTTVALTVAPVNDALVNDAPFATPDNFTSLSNLPLTILAPGVLANDIDVDGDALTAVADLSSPASGMLLLATNGGFTYTPAAGFMGLVSFTYRASDGLATSNATTVTISVATANQLPVAVNDYYTTPEDTPLVISGPGLLANDTDANGDTLLAELSAGASHGSLSIQPTGGFIYTPAPNYFGTDSFRYRARDAALSSPEATVTINITSMNDPPVAVNEFYTGSFDRPPLAPGRSVLANDTDADGDPLTAVLVTGPRYGLVTLNVDGTFVYDYPLCFAGPDAFVYRATDGQLSSQPATVGLNIYSLGAPPLSNHDSYTTPEDAPLTIAAPGVLVNDSGYEPDEGTVAVLREGVGQGTLSLQPNGSFSYVPAPEFSGEVSFTYYIAGDSICHSATVRIVVNPVNDPPIASNDHFNAIEDIPLTVNAPGVLPNDSDPDSILLDVFLVGLPAHGTASLAANGGFAYTPNANYNGTDSFTYRTHDGVSTSSVATVTITVAPVNDPPVATSDIFAWGGGAVTINSPGVIANDVDPDADALTALLVAGPTGGTVTLNPNGSFTYLPERCFAGLASFSYRVSDSLLLSNVATVRIFITDPFEILQTVNDSFSIDEDTTLTVSAPGVLANDIGQPCSPPIVRLVTGPDIGALTLNANGSIVYSPSANYWGLVSFTYRADDFWGGPSNLATVTINVAPVNDPPSLRINPELRLTVDDDSGPQRIENWVIDISAGAPDEQGQSLTFHVTSDHPELFAERPAIDATGALTFTPARNARGSATLTVVLRDNGGGSDSSLPQVAFATLAKPRPWHNTSVLAAPLSGALDVDGDGAIAPIDAVLVINYLNSNQPQEIPANAPVGGPNGIGPGVTAFVDTGGATDGRGDNFISPFDAVLVINWLNANPPFQAQGGNGTSAVGVQRFGEGENATTGVTNSEYLQAIDCLIELLTAEMARSSKRRRYACLG